MDVQAISTNGGRPPKEPDSSHAPSTSSTAAKSSAKAFVLIMTTDYTSADHAVCRPHLPWGQVGSSALTTTVGKSVSLQVHQYVSQADLEQAANQTKIYGGIRSGDQHADPLRGYELVGAGSHARLSNFPTRVTVGDVRVVPRMLLSEWITRHPIGTATTRLGWAARVSIHVTAIFKLFIAVCCVTGFVFVFVSTTLTVKE